MYELYGYKYSNLNTNILEYNMDHCLNYQTTITNITVDFTKITF